VTVIPFVRHAGNILWKDLRRLARDRSGLVMLLVLPIVLMAIVGFSLGDIDPERGDASAVSSARRPIGLLLQDRGIYGERLRRMLAAQGVSVDRATSLAEVQAGVARGRWSIGVVVPPDLTERLERGEPSRVGILLGQGGVDPAAGRLIGAMYVSAAYLDALAIAGRVAADEVRRAAPGADVDAIAARVEAKVFQSAVSTDPTLLGLDFRASGAQPAAAASEVRSVNYFNQVVPGYAVMFALFGIAAGAATLLEEKESGTYRRLLATPVSSGAILFGKMSLQFIITLTQVLILLGVGVLVFGLELRLMPAVFSLVVALSFATTAFGMLLVSLARSRRHLSGMTTAIVLSFSALGGSWWPLWLQPEWVQGVAKLSITYWAMRGFNSILVFHEAASAALPGIIALVAYGALAFALAQALFQRKRVA
jgi:ABC-2 type transport system permease protein